jgi:hypothetical protein
MRRCVCVLGGEGGAEAVRCSWSTVCDGVGFAVPHVPCPSGVEVLPPIFGDALQGGRVDFSGLEGELGKLFRKA